MGRSWGYGLSSAATFLAFLVFLSGTKRYRYRKCVGSLVIQILQFLVAALRKMKVEIPTHVSSLYEDYAKGTIVLRTNRYWYVVLFIDYIVVVFSLKSSSIITQLLGQGIDHQ